MESYQELITRLGQKISDIDANIAKPLAEAANNYRIVAENICKAIITGHGAQPQGPLEKLIADASKFIEANEAGREYGLFKAEIKYLQSVGNAYSHDGADGALSSAENQTRAFDALTKVLRITFFGQSELNAPLLPKSMEKCIPRRTLGRTKFENPRSTEVARLCFPKRRVEQKIQRSDHDNRLVYDYILADLGSGLTKGMLFLRSRTAIERALTDFATTVSLEKLPDALEIITPRAYRPDGGEIDRRKSINDIVKGISLETIVKKVQVKYFDDFVWESCLPEAFKGDITPIKKPSHFIAQSLESIGEAGQTAAVHSSASAYIDKLLNSTHESSPVHIVIGPAGIGKTTFCDDIATHINTKERKRVILLSATDFREISPQTTIESASDLYQLAKANGLLDEESAIESHNFEINLACGNFVLLIDGFDELESHLGPSLNFEKFMHSLADLEECFRKVLVILTVRDYDIERFKEFEQTSICRLRGFSNNDTEKYLKSRLTQDALSEARRLLASFNQGTQQDNTTTVPLYASLICDLLIEAKTTPQTQPPRTYEGSKFFFSGQPLDRLVGKIVDREIAKQSLGDIDPDDFVEILIEIIRAPQHRVTKAQLLEVIAACDGDGQSVNQSNFLRNPFLVWEKETISFRYDSLAYFFKARFLAQRVKESKFSASPSIDFMAEFCHGDGPLYDELRSVLPPTKHTEDPATISWFKSLCLYADSDPSTRLPWRRAMSAFLYWALSEAHDKMERSALLSKYFNGNEWRHFSAYSKFFSLSLIGKKIEGGHIENFTNLQSCDYSPGEAAFFSTHVVFDDRSLPAKIEQSLFSEDCTFSANIAASFQARKMADESGREVVRGNIYKILKVGFRSNRFVWKSGDIYKKVTVVGKFSLDVYLTALTRRNVLLNQPSRAGAAPGYVVADDWQEDTRKLIEENNITKRMDAIVSDLCDSVQ